MRNWATRCTGICISLGLYVTATAQTIHEGYDEYYRTLRKSEFRQITGTPFEGIKHNTIKWEGQLFKLASAVVFPGEQAINDSLGHEPIAYRSKNLSCIEGQSSSSSGTAVRHFSVYVIDSRTVKRSRIFKLPSLFASCLGVRLDEQRRILFDRATYKYESYGDLPTGVELTEFMIIGNNFVPTGKASSLHFVEAGNVWRFTIEANAKQ